MSKALMIGPRKNKKNPDKIGGVIVLFEDLLSYCDAHGISYDVIDTNKENYSNRLFSYVAIVFLLLRKIPRATHLSLHGTANDFVLIAPVAVLFSKLFGTSVSLRKFAGNFHELFEGFSGLKRRIVTWTLQQSTCNFFETRYLVEYFKPYNPHTHWFPNVRKRQAVSVSGVYRKRFVYIGGICREKGIELLCEASNQLEDDYVVDLYGVLLEDYTKDFFNDYKVQYQGILQPEDVIHTLQQYDILLLPSYREGYPGVIIEALSVGLPVIATKLKGIEEMVNQESSVLIEPGSVEQLAAAMQSFGTTDYAQKSSAAKQQFDAFDSDIQTELFFARIGW